MSTPDTSYSRWEPFTKEKVEPLLTELAEREPEMYIFAPNSDMTLEFLQCLSMSINASLEASNWAWCQLSLIKDEYESGSDIYEKIEAGLDRLMRMLMALRLYNEDCLKLRAEKGEQSSA